MPGQAVFMGYPHIRGTVVAAEWQPSFIHQWPGIECPDFLRPFEDTPPPSTIVTLKCSYAHSGVAVGFLYTKTDVEISTSVLYIFVRTSLIPSKNFGAH